MARGERDAAWSQDAAMPPAARRRRRSGGFARASRRRSVEGASSSTTSRCRCRRIPEFIDRAERARGGVAGQRGLSFGHVGDGNLHFNLSGRRADRGRSRALGRASTASSTTWWTLGGSSPPSTASAAQARRAGAGEEPVEIDLMRTVKRALDPAGIMNPGKVVRA